MKKFIIMLLITILTTLATAVAETPVIMPRIQNETENAQFSSLMQEMRHTGVISKEEAKYNLRRFLEGDQLLVKLVTTVNCVSAYDAEVQDLVFQAIAWRVVGNDDFFWACVRRINSMATLPSDYWDWQ